MKPPTTSKRRAIWHGKRFFVGIGLARSGWFADDFSEKRTHYVFAIRVNERRKSWTISLTVLPVFLMFGWTRKRAA